jgi:hypothetical protein
MIPGLRYVSMTQYILVDTVGDADSNVTTPMEDQAVDSHPGSWICGDRSDSHYPLVTVFSALGLQKEGGRMSAYAGTAESSFALLN